MIEVVYFDTSALAKWYLHEARSEEVEDYIRTRGPVAISTLTVVEMRSLLARRRRERDIDAKMEMAIFGTFEDDIREGHLRQHPIEDTTIMGASHLLAAMNAHPLRTLDALHLSIAREIQATIIATADHVMARAGRAMEFSVVRFD